MPDLSAFPITRRWPAAASRSPPALFAADAERREGVDHAGGDRPAVRAALDRHRQERPEDAGIPVAQSERQDPRDHRSRWSGRRAAGPVRIRRDPALSGGEDRQAAAGGCRRGATRPSSGCSSRWARSGRCSARSAIFHKFAGREIEDKRPLERYRDESKRLLGVLETRLDGRQWIMGDDYTIADISMLGWVRNLIGFYGARELVDFDSSSMCRPGWSAAWPAPRCSAASRFRSGRDVGRAAPRQDHGSARWRAAAGDAGIGNSSVEHVAQAKAGAREAAVAGRRGRHSTCGLWCRRGASVP